MSDQSPQGFPFSASRSREDDATSDRARRARTIADVFASRIPPTLPPPNSEAIPVPGRHVRCTAETLGQVYFGGEIYQRDTKGRISARAAGMPNGWCLRLTAVEVVVMPYTPGRSGAGSSASRADPAVLRIQRQSADPGALAQLAAPLRKGLPGRPVHTDTASLFVPAGLAFVREASVVVPLPAEPSGDGPLIEKLVGVAQALAGAARLPAPAAGKASVDDDSPSRRRGHLRIIK